MTTMNTSLPESLTAFVDAQVVQRGFGTNSEYVRQLIRRDQERNQLRDLLLVGATSKPGHAVGPQYFKSLRRRNLRPNLR